MRLRCNLTWHDAMHITYGFLFEMPLIWNATGLLHGHLVWCVKWHLFGVFKQFEWGIYFVNMKQNTSTGKQGTSSHWPMGDVTVSLNVWCLEVLTLNYHPIIYTGDTPVATLKCWYQFGELSEQRSYQSFKIRYCYVYTVADSLWT